ncbi:MAG: hypothetical protein LBD63_01285 [Mycoplasmataceae bacterium]|jgi:hypothetical protein|nr:hypothetical protein [Mycoplasmataceae bacterium]
MKNGLSWFDSKKFSITYVLFSVLAWITILIIQIIHKVNYDDQSLTTTVHVIVPVFCGLSLLYALLSNKFKTNWLIALALFFCFLAELLGAVGVPLNVAVFVGCHICLIVYFFKIKPFSKNDLAKLIPILTFLIIYVLFWQ